MAPASAVPSIAVKPGTAIAVRLIDPIYSTHVRPGYTFRASLDQDLMQDGKLLAAAHSDVQVEVTHWNGKSMGMVLRNIRPKDGTGEIAVSTLPLYQDAKTSGGERAKSGLKWGAVGGLIGAVAGGATGAAVGAGAGGAAGSTIDPGPKSVSLPSETKLEFRTE